MNGRFRPQLHVCIAYDSDKDQDAALTLASLLQFLHYPCHLARCSNTRDTHAQQGPAESLPHCHQGQPGRVVVLLLITPNSRNSAWLQAGGRMARDQATQPLFPILWGVESQAVSTRHDDGYHLRARELLVLDRYSLFQSVLSLDTMLKREAALGC